MKIRCVFFLFIAFVGLSEVFGQDACFDFYKNLIPPSPDAVALRRFGDLKMNSATGIPPVSIPIYEYCGWNPEFNLSISLEYMAGGIRVDDVSSSVGIGWLLNAGGAVSRTMRGLPDESNGGFFNVNIPASENEGNLYNKPGPFFNIYENIIDSQCDIFTYNFLGHSGQFVLGKNNKYFVQNYDNIKISYEISYNRINKFTIIDDKGYQYIFSDRGLANISDKTSGKGISYQNYLFLPAVRIFSVL